MPCRQGVPTPGIWLNPSGVARLGHIPARGQPCWEPRSGRRQWGAEAARLRVEQASGSTCRFTQHQTAAPSLLRGELWPPGAAHGPAQPDQGSPHGGPGHCRPSAGRQRAPSTRLCPREPPEQLSGPPQLRVRRPSVMFVPRPLTKGTGAGTVWALGSAQRHLEGGREALPQDQRGWAWGASHTHGFSSLPLRGQRRLQPGPCRWAPSQRLWRGAGLTLFPSLAWLTVARQGCWE